jgi:hypothetical protein
MGVWDFIQNQILGMKWLNAVIGSLLSSLGLDGLPLGRQRAVFPVRCDKNHDSALSADFHHQLHPELLSAGAEQKDSRPLPRPWRQLHRGAAGYGDAVLLLLLHPAVHRLYQCRSAGGRDVFLFDFLPDGGSRQPRSADEHFRREGCRLSM